MKTLCCEQWFNGADGHSVKQTRTKMSRINDLFRLLKPQQALSCLLRLTWFELKHRIQTIQARWFFWRWGVRVGQGLSVTGQIRCFNRGQFELGNNVKINSSSDNNFVGGDRRTSFWIGKAGHLVLENNVSISALTIVAMQSVTIRKNTFIGGGCDIYDTDFHEIDSYDRLVRTGNIKTAPVDIGANVFVGSHSIILKGVIVGEGAVVGAGSLVTRDIPPYEIWAGRSAWKIKVLQGRFFKNL